MSEHLRFTGLFLIVALAPASLLGQAQTTASDIVQTSVVQRQGESILELELASGRALHIRLAEGHLFLNGEEIGRYTPGGDLESEWRALLRAAGEGEIGVGWERFAASAVPAADREAAAAVRSALAAALGGAVAGTPTAPSAALPLEAEDVVEPAAPQVVVEPPRGGAREIIVGGLAVELTEVEGVARSLGRLGLTPQLARVLNGDLKGPVRIVIDADEYRLPEGARLDRPLVLVQSDAVLAGTVDGNVIVAEGTLRIDPSARIEGSVISVNASVENLGGAIVGQLREAALTEPVVETVIQARARSSARPSLWDNIAGGFGSLARTVAMYLLFGFLGALAVYFFRGHLETVSDTVSFSFGRSFVAGLSAEILFLPLILVMTVLILTIIAIPFAVVGFVLAALLGYLAVAHAAGENLTRYRYPEWAARMRRANSYYYVLNGLGVLLALFAAAAITEIAAPLLGWAHDLLLAAAWILTWVAATSGLGAALLSRGGTQRKYAKPHQIPARQHDTLADELRPLERRAQARRRATEMGENRDEI